MRLPPIASVVALLSVSLARAEPIKGFSASPDGSCRIEWDVLPAPPYASGTNVFWPPGVEIVNGRDVEAYSTDAFMPASPLAMFTTAQAREWKMGHTSTCPFRYNPASKSLTRIVRGRLVVTYERIYGMVKGSSRDPGMAARFRQMAHDSTVNFDDVVFEYDHYDPW